MERNIAIQVCNVTKQYRLGSIGGRTLQADLQSWWAKKRGKEDPNVRIGTNQRLIGQSFMALNGIDLTIYQGERVGIIGMNGAGKSTLLKLLCRVTAPTSGEIDIYGRITSMLEVGTGFHGEMTGRENIYLNGAILGMKKEEIDKRIEDIIDFSEVREFIDTPVKRYSSGMFVKLAFSVAAHLNSEIMIMDEVLAVGDMSFQKKCLARMQQAANEEGRTILYVSHNMNTIRELCERVIVLDQGKVIFDGNVEEGIAVYMNHGVEENRVDVDLTSKTHVIPVDTGLKLTHASLLCKSIPVYEEGEDLDIQLKFKCDSSYAGLEAMVTLHNELDQPLMTFMSDPFDITDKNTSLNLHVPLNSIAKGTFYVQINIVRANDLGYRRLLDGVSKVFNIECIGNPSWPLKKRGYIKGDTIQCTVVE